VASPQTRTLFISLLALLVPVGGAFLFPEQLRDYEALLWLLALVPAFLLAYHKGWSGATVALAAGMALVSVTYAVTQAFGREMPETLLAVVAVYIAITLGVGWLAEGLHRVAGTADEGLRIIDPVTQLPTWLYGERHLRSEHDAARHGRPLALVRFDIDALSDFNAREGRRAGDRVVAALAEALRRHTRQANLSARLGPGRDEFVSVVGGGHLEGAAIFAQKVLESYRTLLGEAGGPTVSGGVAAWDPGMRTPEDLMRAAAEALARAQRDGGDRVRTFGAAVDLPVPRAREDQPAPPADPAALAGPRTRTALLVGPRAKGAGIQAALHEWNVVPSDSPTASAALDGIDGDHDLVVIDLALPASLDLVRAVRVRAPTTQIVALAPADAPSLAVRALHDGATRCLIGEGQPGELRQSLDLALRRREAELRASIERVQMAEEYRARHREVQRTLDATEEHYRAVLEGIGEVVFRLDPSGNWSFLNNAWSALSGRTPRETLGTPFLDAVHDSDRESAADTLRRVLDAEDGRVQTVLRLDTDAGADRWVEMNASLSLDPDGNPRGASGTLVDVTERRRLETQLWQAQKMEAVGRLAGGIAHDFHNLLTAIRGNAEFALESVPTDESAHTDLLEVVRNVDRASGLTRQLLAFSRKQLLQTRVLDLHEVVRSLERMLARLIGEDVGIVVHPAPDLGLVEADPAQIQQVLMNLAVNARDAMPDGGTLRIELANATLDEEQARNHPFHVHAGEYVRMSVIDEGVGMDEDVRRHLFEPFFTTKEPGRGTGLGLATVYGIVKQSGGYIWVESEPAQGARFDVYLPRTDRPVERGPAAAEPAAATRGAGQTVLIVEDEPTVRSLTRRILERAGYRVLDAAGPRQALDDVLPTHPDPIDLLLSDVVMPDMSGPDLAQRMRELRPDTRVLFMSGYAEDEIIRRGIADPEKHLLRKPFTSAEMTRRVAEILEE